MADKLETLALAADLALPMPWEKSAGEVPYAHKQAFRDACDPQTVLALLEVCKAAQAVYERHSCGEVNGPWAALRSALSAIEGQP